MRHKSQRSLHSLRILFLLLGCACALDARAGTQSNALGASIVITPRPAGTVRDGQVDGHNPSRLLGTLSVTPAYAGQTFTFSIVTPPAHGTLRILDPSTGSFHYEADKKFEHGVDSFTFHAVDNHGVTTNTATEYLVVWLPATTQDGAVTTLPNTPVTGTLSAKPSFDSEALTFEIVSNADIGTATLTDPHTGAFSYTPPFGFSGSGKVFIRFRVLDPNGEPSNTSVERITVKTEPATAISGHVSTRMNHAVTGTLSATTAFAGQTLTYTLVKKPAHGKLTLTNHVTGAFKYTPAKGFKGKDLFKFRVTDQAGTRSNTATENITVH